MLDKASYWSTITKNAFLADGYLDLCAQLYAPNAAVHVSAPVGDLSGTDAMAQSLWQPLLAATSAPASHASSCFSSSSSSGSSRAAV